MRQIGHIERAIQNSGPVIDLRVGVSDGWRKQLWRKGIDVPPQVFATFLVDTGSDSCMVDEQIMRTLGLIAVNQRPVITSESRGQAKLCNVYDIGLEIPNGGSPPWVITSVEANGRALMSESVQGVIGRDVLNQIVLTYDGPRRLYSLDYSY